MNLLRPLSLSLQRRFGRQRLRRLLLGAIPFLILLVIWQMNTRFGWNSRAYVSQARRYWPTP